MLLFAGPCANTFTEPICILDAPLETMQPLFLQRRLRGREGCCVECLRPHKTNRSQQPAHIKTWDAIIMRLSRVLRGPLANGLFGTPAGDEGRPPAKVDVFCHGQIAEDEIERRRCSGESPKRLPTIHTALSNGVQQEHCQTDGTP